MRLLRAAFVITALWSVSLRAQSPAVPPPGPPEQPGPPVARLSLLNGEAAVRRGDSGEAVAAALNAPLMTGDAIATNPAARAELQFDFANRVRLGGDSEARLADLRPGYFRIELARGAATLSVIRDDQSHMELSSPDVAVRLAGRGSLRVTLEPGGQTLIAVRRGAADLFTGHGTERLNAGQSAYVRGPVSDPEYRLAQPPAPDDWDRWNDHRDQVLDRSASYQHVNPTEFGVEDLDAFGQWVQDPSYGQVWQPREPVGWTPYSAGQWAWEDYYGWTWVSTDPWGWAPYHFGTWFYGPSGWCWFPGPVLTPVHWRPALVAFFGFREFSASAALGWSHIGWVPLAPYERFYPWYGPGRAGIVNVEGFNVVSGYRNARVPGSAVGVPVNAFTSINSSQPVQVSPQQLRTAGLMRSQLPLVPTTAQLRFSARSVTLPSAFRSAPRVSTGLSNFERQREAVVQSTERYRQTSCPQPGPTGSPWNRFGTPAPGAGNAYRPEAGSAAARSGWDRFGSPNVSAGGNVRLSPPIIHQRAYDPVHPGPYRPPIYAAPRPSPYPSSRQRYSTPRASPSAPPLSHRATTPQSKSSPRRNR